MWSGSWYDWVRRDNGDATSDNLRRRLNRYQKQRVVFIRLTPTPDHRSCHQSSHCIRRAIQIHLETKVGQRIKLKRHWTGHLYPFNAYLQRHTSLFNIDSTPTQANTQFHELNVYVNLKLKANKTRKYIAYLFVVRSIHTYILQEATHW